MISNITTNNTYIFLIFIYLFLYLFSVSLYILFFINLNTYNLKKHNTDKLFWLFVLILATASGFPPTPLFFIKLATLQLAFNKGGLILLIFFVFIYLINWLITCKIVINLFWLLKDTTSSKNINFIKINSFDFISLIMCILVIVVFSILDFNWLITTISNNF